MGMSATALVAGDGPCAAAIAERLARDGVRVTRLLDRPVDSDAALGAASAVIAEHGPFDMAVVANARRSVGPFLTADRQTWRDGLDRELTAPFLIAQAAARAIVNARRAGTIVHVIERAEPAGHSSSVSERACGLMVAATALDLVPSGVRVCGVSGANAPAVDDIYRETMAAAVAFCASDEASYVVGSIFDPWDASGGRWP